MKEITIKIIGATKSGKSKISYLIHEALKNKVNNIVCEEDLSIFNNKPVNCEDCDIFIVNKIINEQ